jgi:NADPH-dependent 7-cyano-7-deazaguanine reductase QueF-like protein
MRNVSDRLVEKTKTHISYSITFSPENRTVYEIMWENIAEPDKPQINIRRMHIAYWIPNTIDTHSEYIVLNCFSTVTVVTRKHLDVTFIRTLPVLL